jgi:peptidoglycan/LPS O-acetylase OafA/YrhL
MNSQIQQKYYYPQLNALRGIGIISVFFYHSYKPPFGTGFLMEFASFCYENIYLSMDMFFALSAFIITHLAFIEIEKYGNFSFKNFMLRRIFRIWPIYFIILAIAYTAVKKISFHYNIPITLPPAGWYVFFVSNFYLEGHVFFLRQLWTISVEEQFYIVWGVSLLLFSKRISLVIVILSIISIVFNFYSAYRADHVYYHSLTYLFDLMCGAYFAHLIHIKSGFIRYISSPSFLKSISLYLFLPIFFLGYYFLNNMVTGNVNNMLDVVMRIIFIVHQCIIFVDQMYNVNSFFNLSKKRFLIYVGKIAYGVYCFHGLILTAGFLMISKLGIQVHSFMLALIMFGITLIAGTISFNFIEKPIIDLKYRLPQKR